MASFAVYIIGNSSQVSDGAGAVLLMKRSVALQKGLPILGVFRFVTSVYNSFVDLIISTTLGIRSAV